MTRMPLWLFLFAALLLPHEAFAKAAEIMMLPTRVVLEKGDRQSTVIIKNTGDATGNFTLELVDMKMQESGMVVPYDKGETPQYSAGKLVHMAPKSFTLKPGETQNVRLLVRIPESLEAGEYRSHLQVRLVNDNVDEQPSTDKKEAVIQVKTNLVIVVPVIVRHGETSAKMGIEDPRLTRDSKGNASVGMYLTRDGNRSEIGDIAVSCNGKQIKFFPGVAVYRPTARRFISVPLDETPKGVDLSRCTFGIAYVSQQKEGSQKLAESQLSQK